MESESGELDWFPVEEAGDGGELWQVWNGENLEVLSEFEAGGRRYDLVYMDPPYNTGRKLRYKDRFESHAKWVEFMRKRVEACRNLLREEGLLVVSIDMRELPGLILLLDEIFGEVNRLSVITVRVKAGAGLSVNSIMDVCEYVVVYAMDGGRWRGRILRREEEMTRRGEYTRRLSDLVAVGENERTGEIAVQEYSYKLDPVSEAEFLGGGIEGVFCTTNSQGVRRYSGLVPKTGLYRVVDDRNHKTTWFYNGRVVLWIEDLARVEGGKVLRKVRETNLWNENWHQGLGAEGGVSFAEGKKPVAMLKRILSWVGADARILDPFAGSGSIVQAAGEANLRDGGTRKVDCINNDENRICTEITWPRVRGVVLGSLADGRTTEPLRGQARLYEKRSESRAGQERKV